MLCVLALVIPSNGGAPLRQHLAVRQPLRERRRAWRLALPLIFLALGPTTGAAQAREFASFPVFGGLPLEQSWTEDGNTVTTVFGQRAFNYANAGLLVTWDLRSGQRFESAFACYPNQNGGIPASLRFSDVPASYDGQNLYLLVAVKLAPRSPVKSPTGDRRDKAGALCHELFKREQSRGAVDGLTPEIIESTDGGKSWHLLPSPSVKLQGADFETQASAAVRLVAAPGGVFVGSNKYGWNLWDRDASQWREDRPGSAALDFSLASYGQEPSYRPFGGKPGRRWLARSYRRLTETSTWSSWRNQRTGQGLVQLARAGKVTRKRVGPGLMVRLARTEQRRRSCALPSRVRASAFSQMLASANGKTLWALTSDSARLRCQGELRTPTGMLVIKRGQWIDAQVQPALVRSTNGGRSWKRVYSHTRVPDYLLTVDGTAPVAAFGSKGCRRKGIEQRRMARGTGRGWKTLGCQPYSQRDDPALLD